MTHTQSTAAGAAASGAARFRSPFGKSERWRFLAEVSVALDATLDLEAIAGAAVRATVPRIADVALLWLLRADGAVSHRVVHTRRELLPLLARDKAIAPESFPRAHPVSKVLRTGEAMWAEVDSAGLRAMARDADQLAWLRAVAPTTWLLVPLIDRGRVLGALMLVTTTRMARRFERADVACGCDLAQRIAAAVAHATDYDAVRARLEALTLQLAEDGRTAQSNAAVARNRRQYRAFSDHTHQR